MIRQEFNVHLLNAYGIAMAQQLAEIFSHALQDIEAIVPAGRERALVVTKLQEAAFFAKRGMALQPEMQSQPEHSMSGAI